MDRSIFSTAGRAAALMARGGVVVAGVISLSACGQQLFAPPSHSASASAQPAGALMGGPASGAGSAYAAPADASPYASASMAPIPNPGDPGAGAYYGAGEGRSHHHHRHDGEALRVDGGAGDPVSIPVSYADLNLANSDGAAVFKRRVMKAIGEICGEADMHDLYRAGLVRRCQHDLWSQNEGQMQQAIARAQTPSRNGSGGVILAAR